MDEKLVGKFWSRVATANKDTGCWEWTGTIRKGYGYLKHNGRTLSAHRLAYEMLVGEIPTGLAIDHLCRHRDCVNPAHMEPVTLGENVMRSPIAIPAVNARKAACRNGHPYLPDNLRVEVYGGVPRRRVCIACKRARRRESYRRCLGR